MNFVKLKRKEIKKENLRRYLYAIDAIRDNKISDKSMLATISGLSWPTVSKMIDSLSELSQEESPIILGDRYEINSVYSYHVGISIGATKIKIVLMGLDFLPIKKADIDIHPFIFDLNNELKKFEVSFNKRERIKLGNKTEKTNPIDSDDIFWCFDWNGEFDCLSEILNTVIPIFCDYDMQNDNFDVLSIGISLPGIINKKTNFIDFCPNIKSLHGVCIKDLINIKVYDQINSQNIFLSFEHDTQAAALFERGYLYREGKIKNVKTFACVYIGTGIGLGMIINNKLCRGETNSFGEIGHIRFPRFNIIPAEEEKMDRDYYLFNGVKQENKHNTSSMCDCGKMNCLESNFRREVFNSDTALDYSLKTTQEELENFYTRHPFRYKVLKEYIGFIINILINIFNTEVIAFSGRIINFIPQLQDELNSLKYSNSIGVSASSCSIVAGSNKRYAAAVGAAISSYYSSIFEENFFDYEWK